MIIFIMIHVQWRTNCFECEISHSSLLLRKIAVHSIYCVLDITPVAFDNSEMQVVWLYTGERINQSFVAWLVSKFFELWLPRGRQHDRKYWNLTEYTMTYVIFLLKKSPNKTIPPPNKKTKTKCVVTCLYHMKKCFEE